MRTKRAARKTLNWVLVLALAMGLAVIWQTAAHAAEVDVIDTGSIKIENTSSSNPNDPLTQWNQTRVSFNYSTQAIAVQPGDTFTLTLPPELSTVNLSWPLKHPDGTTIANCTAGGDPSVVQCTFTADILNPDGTKKYEYLSGNVFVLAQVVRSTTSETVDFGTVKDKVTVDLPGEGGILPGVEDYPEELEKWGWFNNAERDEIHWQIFIPGGKVDNTIAVTVTDTLSRGQTIVGGVSGIIVEVQPDSAVDSWQIVTAGVTITKTPDGFAAVFAPGTIDPTKLYRIVYDATTDNTNVGQTYTNTADINGEDVSVNVVRNQQGGGTADGPGFGGVGVLKQPISGDGASQVPADTTFTVMATYVVDGVSTTKQVSVTAGGVSGELHGLPVGTVVTLTEATPPSIPGITWGTPVFANPSNAPGVVISPDGTSATVTVGDQATAFLELTNTATLALEPSVDIVKKDVAGNDADTTDQAVDLTTTSGATGLVFTITNDGTEALTDVVVSDQVTAGGATATGLSCDFSPLGGPATGTTWDGPFAVGASFACTAQLSGVVAGVPHTDVARVDAIGQTSKIPVDDDNPYNADVTPQPDIEIVKKDAAGNDADTADDAATLPINGSTDLVFTITNTGNEPLVDVAVTDQVTAGSGTISRLSCDFSPLGGPATGTTWAGPFAVDASFTCTAQLTGVVPGELHTDVATVTGKGQYSGTPVDDDNPYNGKNQPPVPPKTTPTNPQPAGPPKSTPTKSAPLAQTGVDAGGLGSLAIAMIAGGLLVIAGGRRRRA